MLQYIKKYIKGWLMGIILFFIFISFTFWGVGDIFSNKKNYILKIGKNKISREFFLAELQSNINYLNKKNEKLNKFEVRNVANETIANIANRYLILNAAKSSDINISEKILRKNIFKNELFQNKLKKNTFDKNIYKNFIINNFGSEKRYFEYLEGQIIVRLISTYFEEKINYPNNLLQAIYNKLEEKKSFEIASIDKNLYRSSIKITDEESVTNYYNKNKDKYLFDERRSFTYIFPNLDKIKKRIEISDEEILLLYNNQKEDFLIPEKRKVEQLFFNNNEIGEKIFKSLKKKDSFKEIGEKEKDISYTTLGLVEKDQLFDEFAGPVFKLNENNFTKVIKTDIGWHILKVTKIIKSKTKNLGDVKNKIKEDLVLNKSYDELENILLEVEKDITDGFSLEEISKKFNLELKDEKLIEKKSYYNSELSKEVKNEKFFNDVFDKETDSDLFIEEVDDGFFVVRVDEIVDKKPMEYKEAYNKIKNDLIEKKIDEKIKKINEKFKLKIKEGVNFMKISDSLKMNSRTTKKLNRENLINEGFSLEFTNKIFESEKNTIHEDKTMDRYYILKVLSDSEINFDDQKFSEIQQNVNKIYGIDNFEQFSNKLEKNYPVSVNENLLNEFVDRMLY